MKNSSTGKPHPGQGKRPDIEKLLPGLSIRVLKSLIEPWLSERKETTTTEILMDCIGFDPGKIDHSAQTRVGIVLKRCGWSRVRERRGKKLAWVHFPTEVGK